MKLKGKRLFTKELPQSVETSKLGKGRCKDVVNLGWLRP